MSGHNADDRGVMHAREIIEHYEAETAVFQHKLVIININKSATEQASVYEAVRYAWKIAPEKARQAEYVLAVQQGLVIGVFKPEKWLEATPENFPATVAAREKRWGFVGVDASLDIQKLYMRKRLPDDLRKKGAANPIRYV